MALGDRREERLLGPQVLPTSTTTNTLFTVGGTSNYILKQVILTNTNGVEALVYLGVNGTAAANRVISALPIAANDVIVWDTALVLSSYDTLRGYADRDGVNITVVGWVKEV